MVTKETIPALGSIFGQHRLIASNDVRIIL